MALDGQDIARLWLLARIDRQCTEALRSLLRGMTEDLSMATADAATVRVLSEDRRWLFPVVAHHPDPRIGAAMSAVMGDTAQEADSGLWRRVLAERTTARWDIPAGYLPPESSPAQREFLTRFPVRAVMAMPLTGRVGIIGGVALVRFVVERRFSDGDEALLAAFARRAALALEFCELMSSLSAEDAPVDD